MPNRTSEIAAEAIGAVRQAQALMLSAREAMGGWRDFRLEPGASEAWTTAYVGHALLRKPLAVDRADPAIRTAAVSITRLRRRGGWGYNSRTAADADSTAWSLRFLAASGHLGKLNAEEMLSAYLTPRGGARTFSSAERFGSWAQEHAEVTPLIGLALVEAGADPAGIEGIERLRRRSLDTFRAGAGWPSYWWDTPAYGLAANLEFLAASGGIPQRIVQSAPDPVGEDRASTIACALLLAASVHLARDPGTALVERLLEMRHDNGAWPPSAVLRVPRQSEASQFTLHADTNLLFGTATAVSALKLWLAARGVARFES